MTDSIQDCRPSKKYPMSFYSDGSGDHETPFKERKGEFFFV